MKKGFTLIELLAVIIVLGFLTAIISPVVTNLINSSKDNLREEQRNLIVEATKKYMIENSDLLPDEGDDSRVFVYTDELVSSGVIDNDKIIDPKTKEDIKGCVVIRYNDEFNQYEYNYEDDYDNCLINVTFDPEDGSVDITSKQVRYNSTYGDLPTPTREGYTFKGWRGKNMFDSNKLLEASGWTEENGVYSGNVRKLYEKYNPNFSGGEYIQNDFKTNTVYYLSFETKNSTTNGGLKFGFNYIDEGVSTNYTIVTTNTLDYRKLNLKSKNNVTINGLYINYNSAQTIWIKNIQLEEGEVTTVYEPYQEYSSDTIVTKDSDHTLHAIWEPNSYTVTFDPEGGSVDTVSKQVRYNSTYGDLPTPTREGYTFKGWRGKNMFDEETILMAITGATKENGYYLFTNRQAHESYGGITGGSYVGNKQMNIVFDDNTQYTFSFSGYTNYLEDLNRYPNFYFGYLYDSGRKVATLASTDDIKKQITSDMPNNVRYISFSYGVGGTVYIHNVQLEKGNTATEYEPYQEYNSDTIVTKPSDHVLHAIWEVAS